MVKNGRKVKSKNRSALPLKLLGHGTNKFIATGDRFHLHDDPVV
jgi:hypothetical protein